MRSGQIPLKYFVVKVLEYWWFKENIFQFCTRISGFMGFPPPRPRPPFPASSPEARKCYIPVPPINRVSRDSELLGFPLM